MAQSAAFHLTKLSETPTDCMIYFYETRTTELKVKRVKCPQHVKSQDKY